MRPETVPAEEQVELEAFPRQKKAEVSTLTFPGGSSSYWGGDGHSFSTAVWFLGFDLSFLRTLTLTWGMPPWLDSWGCLGVFRVA